MDPSPPQSGFIERSYWIASGAFIGFTAGFPWAWVLAGLLPAVIFGVLAALGSSLLWASRFPKIRKSWVQGAARVFVVGGALGTFVSQVFGRIGSDTWLGSNASSCFHLSAPPFFLFDNDLSTEGRFAVAIAGFLCLGTAGAVLSVRGGWQRARATRDADEPIFLFGAASCLVGAALWSATNETLFPFLLDHTRNACSPEVGWIALVGCGLAGVGFSVAAVRRLAAARLLLRIIRGTHATLRLDPSIPPTPEAFAFARGDGPRRSTRPQPPIDRTWTAIVSRPDGEIAYREAAAVHGYLYGDGKVALSLTRMRLAVASIGLVLAAACALAQSIRTSANLRASTPAACGCRRLVEE